MKVLVIGKLGSIVHWLEDTASAFRDAGHETRTYSTVGSAWPDYLTLKFHRLLHPRRLPGILAARLASLLAAFKPRLIVCVGAYWLPAAMLAVVRDVTPAARLVGWVGDRFGAGQRASAALFDHVYYTDSAFADLARGLAIGTPASYLPLAVNLRLFPALSAARAESMAFVANPTPHRMAIVRRVRRPLRLIGRGWKALAPSHHGIESRRIPAAALCGVYSAHRAVFNVRNEANVVAGLNQRCFEPYACATPVLTDAMADLDRCFEPQREILVYRDTDELNELYEKLAGDPAFAQAIGVAGQRRVLAQHTYNSRIAQILADLEAAT